MIPSESKKGEIKPCPFCGGRAYGNDQYACNSDVDVCHFSGFLIEAEDWQSAYCWKRIDELEAQLAEKDNK